MLRWFDEILYKLVKQIQHWHLCYIINLLSSKKNNTVDNAIVDSVDSITTYYSGRSFRIPRDRQCNSEQLIDRKGYLGAGPTLRWWTMLRQSYSSPAPRSLTWWLSHSIAPHRTVTVRASAARFCYRFSCVSSRMPTAMILDNPNFVNSLRFKNSAKSWHNSCLFKNSRPLSL